MASAHIVTSGVVGTARSGQSVFNRMEIVPFMANSMQFSLYVQALLHMMTEVNPDSPHSYYQIAGIHGAPYQSYDGADKTLPSTPEFRGYCSHYSVLFPTWHRPYMALIEQEIQRVSLDKAKAYTNYRDEWIDAAMQLRHPYWDWSKSARPPRELYTDSTLEILLPPLGTRGPIDNPFKLYRFQKHTPDLPGPFNEPGWTSVTHRYGVDYGHDVIDSYEELDDSFSDAAFNARKSGTGTLLLSNEADTWEAFSNDNQGNLPFPATSSLEMLHGRIHHYVGGGPARGHFSHPVVAAFDPFFWLHHAQTDRLLALWSALHPDVWVSPSKEPDGTWTIETKGIVDGTTDLTPFYRTADGKFWTSHDLRGSTDGLFGYSYEEFDGIADWSDKAAVRAHVKAKVEALYPFQSLVTQWMEFDAGASQSLCPPLTRTSPSASSGHRAVLRWAAHVTVKKNALRGSFAVLVFLGDAPADPIDFLSSPNLVGDYCAFVNPTPERCANCIRVGDTTIGGAIDLTDTLVKRAAVASFHPDEVVRYLRRELRWRVWTGSGPLVHPAEVDQLEVDVSATPHYLVGDDEVMVGKPVIYHQVTRGYPGGCRHSIDNE